MAATWVWGPAGVPGGFTLDVATGSGPALSGAWPVGEGGFPCFHPESLCFTHVDFRRMRFLAGPPLYLVNVFVRLAEPDKHSKTPLERWGGSTVVLGLAA